MDSPRLNRITVNSLLKQVLKLSTSEIQKSIKAIVLDGKEKSPRINSPVRPDQSYFGIDEEFVVKNLKDNLPPFFNHIPKDESRRYCESLCEFSRLIARETVSKINNRIAFMLTDISEGTCDGPETFDAVIALIGNITNCLSTSSPTHSQAEDQDLHEDSGEQVRRISHLRKSEENSDDGNGEDGDSGNEYSDSENADPQEDMDDRDSDTLNSDEENSEEENSDEENSEEENSDEENSEEENSEEENSDEENSEEENSHEENSEEENSGDESSEDDNPGDESSEEENSGDESSHDGGGDGLVMYTIKKAKVPPSLIDAHSLIKHLSEKAKQQIKHDEMFVTTFQNVEKIHKAVFKEVLKKIGTAKEVLQFMETQRLMMGERKKTAPGLLVFGGGGETILPARHGLDRELLNTTQLVLKLQSREVKTLVVKELLEASGSLGNDIRATGGGREVRPERHTSSDPPSGFSHESEEDTSPQKDI
ncbi:unnamed protein product [Pleuronectes platessa]|uniref:Uncharacterized protein n=1 Tax=Pleuronectes platessa TaxID=8262 RepID=A0A9N7Y8V0_PLEPL|nr:unnamed protein product [Pleuronectes platessa]